MNDFAMPSETVTKSVSQNRQGAKQLAQYVTRPSLVLGTLIAVFLALEFALPLATAIKIGADEDFELSKATLCLRGYHLYTEIWDDQPPLDTFLISQVLKYTSPSVLAARSLSVLFPPSS